MLKYKEKIDKCSACEWNDTREHKLYHITGIPSSIIKRLDLYTVADINEEFTKAKQISPCFIVVKEQRVKIRENNKFLFPKKIIDLIPNLKK